MSRGTLEATLRRAREAGATAHVFAIKGDVEAAAEYATATIAHEEHGEIIVACSKAAVSSALTAGGALAERTGATVGVATTEGHADLTLDELIAVAIEGLGVALASSPGTAVHTELYELTVALHRGKRESFELERVAAVPKHSSVASEESREEPVLVSEERLEEQRQARAVKALREEVEALRGERERVSADGVSQQERLERRIEKLIVRLGESEAEVSRLRAELEGDRGLASRYREVQGLSEDETGREVKRAMLDGVFGMNRSEGGGD